MSAASTGNQEAVFAALSIRPMTATELQGHCDLTNAHVRTAIFRLRHKGWMIERDSFRGKYHLEPGYKVDNSDPTTQQEALVRMLRNHECTADELAEELEIKRTSVQKMIHGMRKKGWPIENIAPARWSGAIYALVGARRFPAGRVCCHEGCGTILSIYNGAAYCSVHEREHV